MRTVEVSELFEAACISMLGPVPWRSPIEEKSPGVYVIALVHSGDPSIGHLPALERNKWNAGQQILYIGRAKQIRRRIRQYYKHVFGDPRPHRGGQAILLLDCPMQVYWGVSANCEASENAMIEAFRSTVQQMPFANRVRSAQSRRRQT